MENNYNNKDFEQFVKQNADQYRMFPSEKVWKGIHNTLHTRRRWFGIGMALLLLSTGTVTWIMLSPSGKKQEIFTSLPAVSTPVAKNNNIEPGKTAIIIAPVKSNNGSNVVLIASPDNQQKNLFLNVVTSEPENLSKNEPALVARNTEETVITPVITNQPELVSKTSSPAREIAVIKPASHNFTNKTSDNNIPAYGNKITEPVVNESNLIAKNDIYPFSIESVVNSYKYTPKRKRLSWQVFIVPTISYRKLEENKAFLNSARSNSISPNYFPFTDINSVVTHKPDIGLELGFNTGYPLSRNLTITAGLQLNVSKYDIRAYSYPSEVATIALNSGRGTSSVSTITNYRNFAGNKANWLHNLYISASAPVGAELKLTGNKKTYFGIGSTIQPTYILADRAYLISTDYKNYVEVPSLIRRWNINSSFEMFAGYSTGKIKWKVGPQVRYQVLSSFQEKYPVKEHLFDFGLKLGVMLNK